jgi:hypothetical protein
MKPIIIDGKIIVNGNKKTRDVGFYGPKLNMQPRNAGAGFIAQELPEDLADLVIRALLASPEFVLQLEVYANEAAAVTADLKSGTIYRTASGEIRYKL